METRRWSDLDTPTKVGIVLGGLVELVLTTLALRDLARRPRELVRGPKLVWTMLCAVQPVGPVAYLLFGRRGES